MWDRPHDAPRRGPLGSTSCCTCCHRCWRSESRRWRRTGPKSALLGAIHQRQRRFQCGACTAGGRGELVDRLGSLPACEWAVGSLSSRGNGNDARSVGEPLQHAHAQQPSQDDQGLTRGSVSAGRHRRLFSSAKRLGDGNELLLLCRRRKASSFRWCISRHRQPSAGSQRLWEHAATGPAVGGRTAACSTSVAPSGSFASSAQAGLRMPDPALPSSSATRGASGASALAIKPLTGPAAVGSAALLAPVIEVELPPSSCRSPLSI